MNDDRSDILWEKWQVYKKKVTCDYLPDEDEIWRRWWRKRVVEFVNRCLWRVGRPHTARRFPKEQHLWKTYPWIKRLWFAYVHRLVPFVPTVEELYRRWWNEKKYDFLMRKTSQRYRKKRRKKRLYWDIYLNRCVWCRHLQCWLIRLNALFYVVSTAALVYWAYDH